MRSLQKVFVRLRARNEQWPREHLDGAWKAFIWELFQTIFGACSHQSCATPRFWLQSDNTVKECRNTYAARILSCLTQANLWVSSSQNFLGVGHTHEDVDGILSLCKSALDSAQILHTPADVANRLQDKLSAVFQARNIDFHVEIVGSVPWHFKQYFHSKVDGTRFI